MIVEFEWERTSPRLLLMRCQDRFKLQTGTTNLPVIVTPLTNLPVTNLPVSVSPLTNQPVIVSPLTNLPVIVSPLTNLPVIAYSWLDGLIYTFSITTKQTLKTIVPWNE